MMGRRVVGGHGYGECVSPVCVCVLLCFVQLILGHRYGALSWVGALSLFLFIEIRDFVGNR